VTGRTYSVREYAAKCLMEAALAFLTGAALGWVLTVWV